MVCVLCLEDVVPDADALLLCSEESQQLEVRSIIAEHFWLQLLIDDKSSSTKTNVCRPCWKELRTFHEFYMRILRVHELLNSASLSISPPKTDCTNIEQDMFVIVQIPTDPTIKVEVDAPMQETAAMRVTKRRSRRKKPTPIEHVEQTDCLDIDERHMVNIKEEVPRAVVQMDMLAMPSSSASAVGNNANVSVKSEEDKPPRKEPNTNETLVSVTPTKRKCSSRDRGMQKTLQFDEFIAANFKLTCCICNIDRLSNFAALKSHFRRNHNARGYVLCCGKKLLKRGVLVDHIRTHQDPQYFKCQQCEKVMSDRRCLQEHVKRHEEKRERIFRCDVCQKSYHRKTVYMRHMMLHVPDDQKTIPCPQCEKTFPTKYHMNQHLKLVHLNLYAKICDICGKSMRRKEDFLRHQAEHAGAPRAAIQCDLCGIKLTTKYGLTRHLKMVHTEENVQPHTCTVCSKVSPSLQALQRHVQYMHSMQRKHICPMCDKGFKQPTHLREHMTTHTGEVLYTCPHCPKTFNSNANMHAHRKKVHRKEWEEQRLQRYRESHASNHLKPSGAITKTSESKI